MNWTSWGEFAAMGGYGLYVWGSFGVTAVVMIGEVLSLRTRRQALAASSGALDDEHHAGVDYREGTA